jgi:hypothetical protein
MSISYEARQLRNMAMVQKGSEFFKPEEVARRARERARDRRGRPKPFSKKRTGEAPSNTAPADCRQNGGQNDG